MKVVHFVGGEMVVTNVSNSLTAEQISRAVGSRNFYAVDAATDDLAIAEAKAGGFKDLGEQPPLSAKPENDYYIYAEGPLWKGREDFDIRWTL